MWAEGQTEESDGGRDSGGVREKPGIPDCRSRSLTQTDSADPRSQTVEAEEAGRPQPHSPPCVSPATWRHLALPLLNMHR